MNFKSMMNKTKNFVDNFKSPTVAVGCLLIAASIALTASMISGRINGNETSTADSEVSIVHESDDSDDESSEILYDDIVLHEPIVAVTNAVSATPDVYDKEAESDSADSYQSEGWLHGYSYYEYDLLARTIFQEAGICGEYCQWLVGSTVLNRADVGGGIENVVFDYNIFNVAYELFDETPSELSYAVARRLIAGDRDYKVMAFRDSYYHNFGVPYDSVDNMYFSVY